VHAREHRFAVSNLALASARTITIDYCPKLLGADAVPRNNAQDVFPLRSDLDQSDCGVSHQHTTFVITPTVALCSPSIAGKRLPRLHSMFMARRRGSNWYWRFVPFLLLVFGLISSQSPLAHASQQSKRHSYADFDCTDFGTKERAQTEFDKFDYDRYFLDADYDGSACESNSSFGRWGFVVSAASIVLGRYAGRRKRLGTGNVVPLPEGLFESWATTRDEKRTTKFDSDVLALLAFGWWVPYVAMTLLRDHLYPRNMTPTGLMATIIVIGFGATYVIARTRDRWV
jgi:hypothetical protein